MRSASILAAIVALAVAPAAHGDPRDLDQVPADRPLRSLVFPDLEEPADVQRERLLDQPAPNIRLTPVGGRTLDLKKLRGQVVVLEFMATWCGPCHATFPALAAFVRKHARRGVRVLAVSAEPRAELAAFARKHRLPFTVARDAGGAAMEAYLIDATPTLVVIDRAGVVRSVTHGAGPAVDAALRAATSALAR